MENVLIIGHSGLVGRALCERLRLKYIVHFPETKEYNIDDLLMNNSYKFLIFCAQSGDYKAPLFTTDLFETNVSLLHAFLQRGLGKIENIISFSSGSVYKISDEIITENCLLDMYSTSPYVASKIAAECILRTFRNAYNSISILRPFFIYGKGQRSSMLIKNMIDRIKNHEEILLGEDAGLVFNPVYVDDVADCVEKLMIMSAHEKWNRDFNVYGPDIITLKDVVLELGGLLSIKPKIKATDSKAANWTASSNYRELWSPSINFREGLSKTLD